MPIKYLKVNNKIQATELDDNTVEVLSALDAERKPQWLENDHPDVIQHQAALAAQAQQNAMLAVKFALQDAIDGKAIEQGYSKGDSFMLYASYSNPFKAAALKFATWEASVWVQAEAYKTQVLAGTAPILTPEQAVDMMPAYPT